MIPASLLEHRPSVAPTALPRVANLPEVPLELWPADYTEGPCAAEMGVERLHRDGVCCHCLALEVAEPDASDGDPA